MEFFGSENFNAEIIAEETRHLEDVLSMMREQIELLSSDGFAYRIVNFYDDNEVEEYRTDVFRHAERKRDIEILKKALSTPYFARMKLQPYGESVINDAPSMTRQRSLSDGVPLGETDIYVGANVIFYREKIIVFSHNSPLGNRIYDRFENGLIEYGGFRYKVVFRRKFDIRGGKLEAMFQDYTDEEGGVVYDKFLAHMMEVRRGDKRLTDIIPTIQANQNAIIVRPAGENCVVAGCAGCGKTMILLQRLEYLSFNKKLDRERAMIVAPSDRYLEHIQPVIDDLMLGAVRRLTMPELYRELILSLRGIKAAARRAISSCTPCGDESLDDETAATVYSDGLKRKLIASLLEMKKSYKRKLSDYRDAMDSYERERSWSHDAVYSSELVKPKAPAISIDLDKLSFVPPLGEGWTKAKLYLLFTAYCYVLGKPSFDLTLFIDEGQDLFFNEYRLLAECTSSKVNIYGDTNQQLVAARGLGDFSRLDALWDVKHYSLNENYRNAREITEYVNDLLGMSVTSLGLDGGKVRFGALGELPELLENTGDDRVAVIYSASDAECKNYLRNFVPEEDLYTVAESKGMEYERVFVCGKLSDREKYVAYTRALAELTVME